MKLNFNIDYRTNWGESVYIVGHIPELGDGDESRAVKLELDGVGLWSLSIGGAETMPHIASFTFQFYILPPIRL